MVPCSQHQPRITVVLGTMMVFAEEKRRLQDLRISRTLCQLLCSSSVVCPPQNRSSNFAMLPSCSRSAETLHISSSRGVSLPGIPIADRTYALTPFNGVATPQCLIVF